jgi:hypothetical protein
LGELRRTPRRPIAPPRADASIERAALPSKNGDSARPAVAACEYTAVYLN